MLTPEQLAALRKVAEKYRRVREGFRNGKYERSDVRDARVELDAAFDPTTCLALLEEVERLRAERDILGEAIAQEAIKAGIIDGSTPLTGPQLLMLCEDLAK
jgi:hypothetical protein